MKSTQLLILGIGNILWADEGFGVRCVEAMNVAYQFGHDVVLMDGGTQGLYLLPYLVDAHRLIVFDAVDYGKKPGEMVIAKDDEVPRFMGVKKMSLHQTGFQEVIACASLTGKLPDSMALIGVQPEHLEDFGGSLRDCVKTQIPTALNIALELMVQWGIPYAPRTSPLPCRCINGDVLDMDNYETNRPSAELACRFGDERFLAKSVGDLNLCA
ncbi:HyaD/HybD family hydrogenase maturation endopeptidase [Ferrovum myxofaciens]|uniref:HyaD/HybD family hydrogenase maturation endopeptidase n=2 Tax=root TaxID=1 RepID=A0A8F3DUV9_9PROT|nr:HyaD/HybD family hydrogenase maturation endopeptidase [Ferrovum myxofaciens]KXW58017.1 hydrogenase 1 maturation protease [Ferrovum myxofaciens]MBU6993626.1 HyaD/HybD family hydrogenase maturation endopeptidase [Ferrovum myxofaciens]QKE37559.1 MAG: HyaD/HybD family hydrogenase maturation endopeptidase [Ferrovum myxofaciens]QKE40115.1 MAG: HyaD/HybD family hydrogenase maturation endopeptidase [Ferrovum myxofaciens]QWY75211.1 MAG: HyaD/HybD family hydrogenase maturation endopeptidase [Ferrovum